MNAKILKMLEKNARITDEEIATVTGLSVDEVRAEIGAMEAEGIICSEDQEIDHINGKPNDNRMNNMRVVSHMNNMKNHNLYLHQLYAFQLSIKYMQCLLL